MTVSRECADVQEESVSGWYQQLKTLMIGYKPKDIWNTDETGCFFFFQIRIDFNCFHNYSLIIIKNVLK